MMKEKSFILTHSGLYYKPVTILNDDCSVISKRSFKFSDDPRVVIYDHLRFIIQAQEREYNNM